MEHCDGPEATEQFESGYGFATCAKDEFECVVGEEGVNTETWTLMEDAVPKVASKTGVRVRDARTLSEVLKSAEVEKANLGKEEMVALRLLTGPMHELYNLTLRGGGGGAEDGKGARFATTCLLISSGLPPPANTTGKTPFFAPRAPPACPALRANPGIVFSRARRLTLLGWGAKVPGAASLDQNSIKIVGWAVKFSQVWRRSGGTVVSLGFANHLKTPGNAGETGLAKLARVGAALKGDAVYRGLRGGGEQFVAGLLAKDDKGFASVVDLSFLSVTENRAKAERHAARAGAGGGEQGAKPTILEIKVGKTSMGSCLRWVALFPEDEAIAYPPRTHLEVVGAPREEGGFRVITLRPTVDQSVRTLEQMRAARKEGVLELVNSLR